MEKLKKDHEMKILNMEKEYKGLEKSEDMENKAMVIPFWEIEKKFYSD